MIGMERIRALMTDYEGPLDPIRLELDIDPGSAAGTITNTCTITARGAPPMSFPMPPVEVTWSDLFRMAHAGEEVADGVIRIRFDRAKGEIPGGTLFARKTHVRVVPQPEAPGVIDERTELNVGIGRRTDARGRTRHQRSIQIHHRGETMSYRSRLFAIKFLAAALAPFVLLPGDADAQVLRRVREQVQQRVETAIDKRLPDASKAAEPTPESKLRPGEGVWANYDFVPGERVLFADDFSADRVGDFPRRMRLQEGTAEIVEWNNARYLSIPSFTTIVIPLGETLPQKFTIEFDFYPGMTFHRSYDPILLFSPESAPRSSQAARVNFASREAGIVVGRTPMMTKLGEIHRDKVYTVRVMADGAHMKAYINERRVSNAPSVEIPRSDVLVIHVPAWEEDPSLIGNIRIASGGLELYDAIEAEGRVAMQGILFDTGADRLRPESTPTLLEIAKMLKDNPALALTVEGHTDSSGNAAANQTLSEQRAAAVVRFLVQDQGIDAARLEAKGFGPTRPVASNDSPEGRQQNRRVELVKR